MAGIYFHIPFCKQKCSYCDFHFSTSYQGYRQRMIDAMQSETLLRKDFLTDHSIVSIYFGGGTPSLLNPYELAQLMNTAQQQFVVAQTSEITLEANPDDITKENLKAWLAMGINRLSIGIQSFDDNNLGWMNRAHSAQESLNCLKLVQDAGFENFSIDLIYGLPGQSIEEWKKTLDQVIALKVPHISAYCLTIEERTHLANMVKNGVMVPSSEDLQSEHFHLLVEILETEGYHHYEISNFSKPGREAVHNSNYWKGEEYLGIGPSAHSFYGNARSWNIANNVRYMSLIEQQDIWYESEYLTNRERWNELLLTGLRTSYGVNLEQLYSFDSPSSLFQKNMHEFIEKGWVLQNEGRIYLTREGKLRADYIAAELFIDA